MAEIKKLWCVRNPSSTSELDDIFFELAVPNELVDYIHGAGNHFKAENHKLYDDSSSAEADAEKRMAKKPTKTANAALAFRVMSKFAARTDFGQVLYKPAEADKHMAEAYTALAAFKDGLDTMEEIPADLMPYYKQVMKAQDAVARAKQEVYQLREMAKRIKF